MEALTTTTPNAVIALNPQQMADARRTTTAWVDAKIESATRDMDEADEVLSSMITARLNPKPARSQLDKAAKRLNFYEKVKAALAAGYYIVPPFDVQLFAVRVKRRAKIEPSTRTWANESRGQGLTVGEGRYVHPTPPRIELNRKKESVGTPQERTVITFGSGEWIDEIDLPVRAMRPSIIREVGRALEQKIFDALGIAPHYRAADPIICGRINKPSGGHLSFLVAWWIDIEDLEA